MFEAKYFVAIVYTFHIMYTCLLKFLSCTNNTVYAVIFTKDINFVDFTVSC